ncbi:MAG: hypothetical protein ACLR5S_04560 [Ruminococcus sp.]
MTAAVVPMRGFLLEYLHSERWHHEKCAFCYLLLITALSAALYPFPLLLAMGGSAG